MEEAFTLLGVDLLRVVEERQGPDAMATQSGVVEQDAGDDQRPCERPATGLVGACHEPDAEAAIVAEQPLAGRERHGPRISPSSRTGSCPTSCRLYTARVQPASGASSRTRVVMALPTGIRST